MQTFKLVITHLVKLTTICDQGHKVQKRIGFVFSDTLH